MRGNRKYTNKATFICSWQVNSYPVGQWQHLSGTVSYYGYTLSSYNQHASVVGTLSKSIPAGSTISVMTSNPNSGLGEGAFAFVYNGNIIHEALINRKWNGQAGSAAAYPGVGNYYIGVTIPAGTQVYISPWYGGSPTVNFSDPTSTWEFAFKIN